MLLVAGLVLGVAPVVSSPAPRAKESAPSSFPATQTGDGVKGVVVFVIDTLRADHVSCLGSARARTRVTDDLARRGVRFSCVISQGPWTLPSVGSLLTGRFPSVHGAGRSPPGTSAPSCPAPLSPDLPTLPEVLTGAGWTCAAFLENVGLAPVLGFNRGFHTYRQPSPPAPAGSSWWEGHRLGAWRLKTLQSVGYQSPEMLRAREMPQGDAAVVAAAAEWVRQHAGSRFFLWVQLMAPHDYMHYYAARLGQDGSPRMLSPHDPEPVRVSEVELVRSHMRLVAKEGKAMESLRRRYAANVMYADALLGVLLDALRDAGALDNTLVVVLSDHGEEFMEHGGVGHGRTLYDEQIHVPLVMACPGRIPAGRVVAQQVSTIDVMPTILELAGVRVQAHFNGLSLVPHINGAGGIYRTAFSEFPFTCDFECARWATRKLIVKAEGAQREFYDLARDPGEQWDATSRLGADAAAMAVQHTRWQKRMELQRRDVRASTVDASGDMEDRMRVLGYTVE